MATVLSVTNTFPVRSKKINKQLRDILISEVSYSLSRIRNRAADKYIIKNKFPRERRPRRLYELQPTDAYRLTSRTGALTRMLRDIGGWRKYRKRASSVSDAVSGYVNTISENPSVQIEGKLTVNVRNTSTYSTSKHTTKQKLRARFFWDLDKGVRGYRRPFIAPAAEDDKKELRRRLVGRINAVK